MTCGKGAYVRAIARDLGRRLGCLGHVTALRRTRVGLFTEQHAFTLNQIENENMADTALSSVETGLLALPCIIVDRDTATRLRRGSSIILRGRHAPNEGIVYAACEGVPVAFGEIIEGALAPHASSICRSEFSSQHPMMHNRPIGMDPAYFSDH